MIAAILFGLLPACSNASSSNASPSDSPSGTGSTEYFVDGARPSPGAGTGTFKDGEQPPGCVPYSADREDVYICGANVPSNYTPPPKPYADSGICSAALDWVDSRRAELIAGGATQAQVSQSWPALLSDSCLVDESTDSAWQVSFVPRDGGSRIFVPFDPSGSIPGAAHPREAG